MTNISVWGACAEHFAERYRSARIAGVFSRSLHLEADGNFLCIGHPSICKGPLNAIVDAACWTRVAPQLLTAGAEARIDPGTIEIGSLVFGTAAALRWLPPPWPRPGGGESLAVAVNVLAHRAHEQAPADGIVRIVVGSEPRSAFERLARTGVWQLRDWVSARLSGPLDDPAPVGLLGFGPGLTPSGDDMLCGALVALYAIGRVDAACDLYEAIAGSAPSSTCLLSRALLKAAGQGHCWEPLHATIIALLENQPVDSDLGALTCIGHRSGWDALAGAVLVLQAYGSIDRRPCRVARHAIS